MRRRVRPKRPRMPTTPPRIIGARRLALLKLEEEGPATEPVVLCREGVLVAEEKEMVGVEIVEEDELALVTLLTLSKLSFRDMTDQELLVVLKILRVF
jgi:hypothetical protein